MNYSFLIHERSKTVENDVLMIRKKKQKSKKKTTAIKLKLIQ